MCPFWDGALPLYAEKVVAVHRFRSYPDDRCRGRSRTVVSLSLQTSPSPFVLPHKESSRCSSGGRRMTVAIEAYKAGPAGVELMSPRDDFARDVVESGPASHVTPSVRLVEWNGGRPGSSKAPRVAGPKTYSTA